MPQNSRALAAGVICEVLRDGQSLTSALERTLKRIPDPKDRAFVQALCFGTARWYHRLDFVLHELLRKPLKKKQIDIRALALVGLYQLRYSRVKTHAAVSETVAAAAKKPWAKSLLNALFRSYLRNREAIERRADGQKTAATSHPHWLIDLMNTDWPDNIDQLLWANNQHPPMTLRLDLAQSSREAYLQGLDDKGWAARPSAVCDTALILESPADVNLIPGFSEGMVSVQDTGAQLAAQLLGIEPGHRVLDACAAPGGKSLQILQQYPTLGELVALDIDAKRLSRVRENLDRCSLRASLVVGDAARPSTWWDGKMFDRILIDAPCMAIGVIRRHPDIKLLRMPQDLAVMAELQSRILDSLWNLLVPGGVLVYATCSVSRSENEKQIMRFLETYPDAKEVTIKVNWGTEVAYGRQILTGDCDMDGFYYARLEKVAKTGSLSA